MSANVEAMVRAGIEAYRAGNSAEARTLLEKAIELDDYNEQAWMWLSAVVETEEEKRTCLENVLVINPENEEAQRGLKMLGVDGTVVADKDSSTANPFTDTGMSSFGEVDFTADSDSEWGDSPPTATSSASSTFTPPETSAGVYDDWVNDLGIGSAEEGTSEETSNSKPSSPAVFPTGNVDDIFGLDDDDDIFGSSSDPFGSEPKFDSDDSFTSGPFGGEDTFDDDLEERINPPPAQPTSEPIVSPGVENIGTDGFLEELDSADFAGGDFIIGDEAFDDDGQSDLTPDELFSFIPDEITATRLPGTKAGVGIVSIFILLTLVVMNIGALAFIFTSL